MLLGSLLCTKEFWRVRDRIPRHLPASVPLSTAESHTQNSIWVAYVTKCIYMWPHAGDYSNSVLATSRSTASVHVAKESLNFPNNTWMIWLTLPSTLDALVISMPAIWGPALHLWAADNPSSRSDRDASQMTNVRSDSHCFKSSSVLSRVPLPIKTCMYPTMTVRCGAQICRIVNSSSRFGQEVPFQHFAGFSEALTRLIFQRYSLLIFQNKSSE